MKNFPIILLMKSWFGTFISVPYNYLLKDLISLVLFLAYSKAFFKSEINDFFKYSALSKETVIRNPIGFDIIGIDNFYWFLK